MKRQIRAGSKYNDFFTIQHGPRHFAVHFNDEGPYEGSFAAQVTEIHPYDDADYAWAKIGFNGQAEFIKNGKVIDKMQLASYDPDDYEEYYENASVDTYINDMLDSVAVELLNINRDVKPVMVHN